MESNEYVIKIGECFVISSLCVSPWGRFTVGKGLKGNRIIFTLEGAEEFLKAFGVGEIFSVHLRPLILTPSFDEWLALIKEIFDATIAVPFDSVNYRWRGAYESGWTPEEAIEAAEIEED